MQLDQARVAICERTWFDNLDLALHVVRRHAAAAAVCALVGILPLALLNHALAERFDARLVSDSLSGSTYYLLGLLVMLEAPLATAPLTLFLGKALFVERPTCARSGAIFWAASDSCCCCKWWSAPCSSCR